MHEHKTALEQSVRRLERRFDRGVERLTVHETGSVQEQHIIAYRYRKQDVDQNGVECAEICEAPQREGNPPVGRRFKRAEGSSCGGFELCRRRFLTLTRPLE